MAAVRPTLKTARGLSLSWTYLDEVASGVSAIDLGALALRDVQDARQFAREYGFNVDQPRDLARIRRAHGEAVQFIEDTFLEPHQRDLIPREVADPVDVLQLLVFASRHVLQADARRLWSCAVLKVMHCVFYIDNNLKLRHFNAIRRQVFAAFDEVLRSDGDRHYLSDGEICLPLLVCEKKSNKGRRSILLKLLQKAAYVAADICDHLGLRLVLNTRFECLLALRILQRAHLVSVINIEPQRTRNTLLDIAAARQVFARYRDQLDRAEDYPFELLQEIDRDLIAQSSSEGKVANPHSASSYRSLQITVRKMIHLDRDDATATSEPRESQLSDTEESDAANSTVDFFFEYEIQLLDRASHTQAMDGPASHGAYKQRQIDTARRRVFGPELMAWLRAQR